MSQITYQFGYLAIILNTQAFSKKLLPIWDFHTLLEGGGHCGPIWLTMPQFKMILGDQIALIFYLNLPKYA